MEACQRRRRTPTDSIFAIVYSQANFIDEVIRNLPIFIFYFLFFIFHFHAEVEPVKLVTEIVPYGMHSSQNDQGMGKVSPPSHVSYLTLLTLLPFRTLFLPHDLSFKLSCGPRGCLNNRSWNLNDNDNDNDMQTESLFLNCEIQ